MNAMIDHTRSTGGRLSRMAWPDRPNVLFRALWRYVNYSWDTLVGVVCASRGTTYRRWHFSIPLVSPNEEDANGDAAEGSKCRQECGSASDAVNVVDCEQSDSSTRNRSSFAIRS